MSLVGSVSNHIHVSADGLLGTSFVYDDISRPGEDGQLDSRVKYDRSGPVPIILVPQPSDDPNDPLVIEIAYRFQRGN